MYIIKNYKLKIKDTCHNHDKRLLRKSSVERGPDY